MAKTIKQHFVPQFLLSHFANAESQRLYAFDKWEEREFPTTPEKAAKESGFYDFEIDGNLISLEGPLASLEAAAAPVILKLIETHRVVELSEEERVTLGLFCVVQMSRDQNRRAAMLDFRDRLREHLKKLGADPKDVKGFKDPTDEEMRAVSIVHLSRAHQLLPYILNKTWSLQIAPPHYDLYISDSPITLHNEQECRPYGNLGLAVRGIEINLPISSRLNLWMTCKSIEDEWRSRYPEAVHQRIPSLPVLMNLAESFDGTKVFHLQPENIERLNSLQVAKAERFIYSGSRDFSLAKRMIADNPLFKRGARITIN